MIVRQDSRVHKVSGSLQGIRLFGDLSEARSKDHGDHANTRTSFFINA